MKLRKILSARCAAAVLTAALPAVSAAEDGAAVRLLEPNAYDNEDDAYNMGGDPPVWRLVYIANNGGLPAFGRGEGVDVYAKMSNNNVAYITSCTVLAYY